MRIVDVVVPESAILRGAGDVVRDPLCATLDVPIGRGQVRQLLADVRGLIAVERLMSDRQEDVQPRIR
jgi:hypothetical protein